MKKLLLLVVLLTAVSNTMNAQQLKDLNFTAQSYASEIKKSAVKNVFTNEPAMVVNFRAPKSEAHWRKLRNVGITLTVLGTGCIIGGAVLVNEGDRQNERTGNDDVDLWIDSDGDKKITAGILGIAGGIVALGGGIPMWAIGGNRLKKYADRVSIKTGSHSASIAFRF